MLSDDERDRFVGALTRVLADTNALQLLQAHLSDAVKAELRQNLNPAQLANHAVLLCIQSGYSEAPPALKGLIDLLEDNDETVEAAVKGRISCPPPTPEDPFDAEILDSRQPFANRVDLRETLKRMKHDNPPQPVLVIHGADDSGKSHCAQLIDHYCRHAQYDSIFCKFPMPKGLDDETEPGAVSPAQSVGPEEIARELISQLGGDPSDLPPVNTNRKKWYDELAQKVVANANREIHGAYYRTWFVLDGMDTRELRDDTSEFLVSLARRFSAGLTARHHKLVFCGFGNELLSELQLHMPGKLVTYETEPLTTGHLRRVVTTAIETRADISEDERGIVVEEVLAMVTAGAPGPFGALSGIGERLGLVVRQGNGH